MRFDKPSLKQPKIALIAIPTEFNGDSWEIDELALVWTYSIVLWTVQPYGVLVPRAGPGLEVRARTWDDSWELSGLVTQRAFLWALVMGPFDSGWICSMGPCFVHGI